MNKLKKEFLFLNPIAEAKKMENLNTNFLIVENTSVKFSEMDPIIKNTIIKN